MADAVAMEVIPDAPPSIAREDRQQEPPAGELHARVEGKKSLPMNWRSIVIASRRLLGTCAAACVSDRVHLRSSTAQVAHQDTQCGAGLAPATIAGHLMQHDDIGRAGLRGSDHAGSPQ